jgi:hypothetical protein
MDAGIVTEKSTENALHVAIASISGTPSGATHQSAFVKAIEPVLA